MDMKEKLQEIRQEAVKRIQNSDGLEQLNEVRVAYLGKKGQLTAVLKGMKDVAPQDRPAVGQLVNDTRAHIEEFLEDTKKRMEQAVRERKLAQEVIDVTLRPENRRPATDIPIPSPWKKWNVFLSAWATKWWKARRWNMMNIILPS